MIFVELQDPYIAFDLIIPGDIASSVGAKAEHC